MGYTQETQAQDLSMDLSRGLQPFPEATTQIRKNLNVRTQSGRGRFFRSLALSAALLTGPSTAFADNPSQAIAPAPVTEPGLPPRPVVGVVEIPGTTVAVGYTENTVGTRTVNGMGSASAPETPEGMQINLPVAPEKSKVFTIAYSDEAQVSNTIISNNPDKADDFDSLLKSLGINRLTIKKVSSIDNRNMRMTICPTNNDPRCGTTFAEIKTIIDRDSNQITLEVARG